MPRYTKMHVRFKLCGISQNSKHQSCIPQQDLSNGTKSAPIKIWHQTLSQKYNSILFFSLIFPYLSLHFSYLGYIVEDGRMLCVLRATLDGFLLNHEIMADPRQ